MARFLTIPLFFTSNSHLESIKELGGVSLGVHQLNFDTRMNLLTWVLNDMDEFEKQMKLTTLLTLIT